MKPRLTLPDRKWIGYSIAIVVLMLSLRFLLDDNMGETNELDVLPLARQFVNPAWNPADWYLNQPARYRVLFETFAGRMIEAWGFLAASIVGRLVCYSLVGTGLVLVQRRLGLSLPLLLPVVAWMLYANNGRGLIAREWMVDALEAKAVAYGFVMLGLAALLGRSARWTAFCLGLATSFHVLVGGWMSLVVFVWGLWRSTLALTRLQWVQVLLIYLVASAAAIDPIGRQLLSPSPETDISPSLLYVYLRLSHHLNPLSWTPLWMVGFTVYVALLVGSMMILRRCYQETAAKTVALPIDSSIQQNSEFLAQRTLFELTLLTLVPFLLGVAIAQFDTEGKLLQFYWFRLGDVMLPLGTTLLVSCAVQQWVGPRLLPWIKLTCITGIAVVMSLQLVAFREQWVSLRTFPNVDPDLQAVCTWIKNRTPQATIVITPPVELTRFTWLSERGTIAKFKFLPQNKASIAQWHERLRDLGGGNFPIPPDYRTRSNRGEIMQALTQGYDRLNTRQVRDLMQKYDAAYFLTQSQRRLNLPVVRQAGELTLYGRSP